MWLEILLISIFILINGFFAASEIAVVTSRRSRIKQLMEEGNKNAIILNKLRETPDRFLATIQIGITFAGAIASAVGGAAAVKVIKPLLKDVPIPIISASSEAISIGIVVVIITYFSLIFGELIPKSIALSNPENLGMITAPTIDKFSKIATVLVRILTMSTNILLKPFGKKTFTEREYISEEELKLLLEEGREQGVFEPEEKKLIHSVFEFTDTFVKEVMIPSPQMVTVGINKSVDEVKSIIFEEKFSRYPVIGKDINDIRGFLYAKDFFNILSSTSKVDLRKIIKPPIYTPETMKITILLREMQKKRVHMAIAIDEYGAVSGLVTLEDLIEEIVGEIRDEYDTESPVIQLGDGSMIIDASISIRDLGEDYNIEIPESPEYETLGGFIVTFLQKIPQTGDTVEIEDKRLKIIEMVGQRIAKVKLELLPKETLEETL
ncbi:MAG: hemolysin family protein [Nitrospirota bacterium]|nr:hemolysin family protein [Nitrospirota bacterium]MDH5768688.1 hemolysin family protein [Nitrospirota bacterium]